MATRAARARVQPQDEGDENALRVKKMPTGPKRRALADITANALAAQDQAGHKGGAAGKAATAQEAATAQRQDRTQARRRQSAVAIGSDGAAAAAAAAGVATQPAAARVTRSQARVQQQQQQVEEEVHQQKDAKQQQQPSASGSAPAGANEKAGPCNRRPAQKRRRSERQEQQQLQQQQQQQQQQRRQHDQQQPPASKRQRRGSAAAAPAAPRRPQLPDIDGADRKNPRAAVEYVEDVYRFYRRVEPQFRVPHDYMQRQGDINVRMRLILVEWLVEVHHKLKLMPDTLFLAVCLLDRYLSAARVKRKELQLIGATALLIAAKYEETWAPQVRDMVYISSGAFTHAQVLSAERAVLRALGHRLTQPTTYQYLARLLKAAGAHLDKPLALFVAYCAELALVDYGCLRFGATQLAAGIMYTALTTFGRPDPYPPALEAHAFCARGRAVAAAKAVVALVRDAAASGSPKAVVAKYTTDKYQRAALVEPPLAILALPSE